MEDRLPTVTVVVLNYNGEKLIQSCLSSVIAQKYPQFDVICVENGSSDNSAELVRSTFPTAKLLIIKKNRDFAGGMNFGVREANSDLVLLLNNDVTMNDLCLLTASKAMTESGADICGCGTETPDGSPALYEEGLKKTPLNFRGAAVIIKKSLWNELEGLDENFRSYFELKDFAIRATLLGHKTIIETDARIFHLGSATTGKFSDYMVRNKARNFPMLVLKNFEVPTVLVMLSAYFISRGVVIMKLMLNRDYGQIASMMRGYLEFASLMPAILRKRRLIQKTRVVRDNYIFELRGRSAFRLGLEGGI